LELTYSKLGKKGIEKNQLELQWTRVRFYRKP